VEKKRAESKSHAKQTQRNKGKVEKGGKWGKGKRMPTGERQ